MPNQADAKAAITLDSSGLARDMAAVAADMRQRVAALERDLKLRLSAGLDEASVNQAFTALKGKLEANKSTVDVGAKLDDAAVTEGLGALQLKLDGLDGATANANVDLIGAGAVGTQLDELAGKLQGLPNGQTTITADGAAAVEASLAGLHKSLLSLPEGRSRIIIAGATESLGEIGKVTAGLQDLPDGDARLNLEGLAGVLDELGKVAAQLQSLPNGNAKVDLDGIAVALLDLEKLATAAQTAPDADLEVILRGALGVKAELDAIALKAQAMPDADIDVNVDKDGRGLGGLSAITGALGSGGAGGVAGAAAAVGAAIGALGIGISAFGLKAAADLETTRTAFSGLLGSPVAGSQFVSELQQFAAETPFAFEQVSGAAQKLIGSFGAGFRSEVTGFLSDVGGVAAALGVSGESVDRVTTALLQMKGKGKASAEEIQQIAEALPGFNAYAAIAEARGTSVAQVMKDMQAGTIGADEAITAIRAGMQAFPGAATAMADQAKTLSGTFSTLKDNISIKMGEAFTGLAEGAKTSLGDLATSISGGPISLAIDGIATSVGGILPKAQPFLDGLATGLSTAFDGLATGLGSVMDGLTPLLAPLGEILGSVFETVGGVVGALLPVFAPILEMLGTLAKAIGPVLVEAAGQLSEKLLPVYEQLYSSISELIPPLTEAFGAVLEAVLPLLPPLLQLATSILPLAVPVITLLANGITFLVGEVTPAIEAFSGFVTQLTEVTEAVSGFLGGIASGASSLLGFNTEVTGKLGPAFTAASEGAKAAGTEAQAVADKYNAMATAATESARELNAAKLTAFTAEVKTLATPAELASRALDALAAAVKDLGNEKLDLTQARAEVEKFLDEMLVAKDEVGKIDFNVDTAAGRQNFDSLTTAAKKFAEEAIATAKATGDTGAAVDTYAMRLGQLKKSFTDAGVPAEEFDRLLTEMGLDPYSLEVVVDSTEVATLQSELDKLKSDPKTQIYLQTLLDQGETQKVKTALDLIRSTQEEDPIAFETFVEESSRLGAEKALENLAVARGVDLEATADTVKAETDLKAVVDEVRTAVFGTEAPDAATIDANLNKIAAAVRTATIGTEAPGTGATGAQIDAVAKATRLAIIGTDAPNAPATDAQLNQIARATRIAVFGTDAPTAAATGGQLDAIARAARIAVFGTDAPNANATKSQLDAISNFIRTAAYGTTADTALTKAQLDGLATATRTAAYGTTANTSTAASQLDAVAAIRRDSLVTANADVAVAEYYLSMTARDRYPTITATVKVIGDVGYMKLAKGGMFMNGVQTFHAGGIVGNSMLEKWANTRFFRDGGMDVANGHVAEMARAASSMNQVRIWAEPETKGESYIPHADDWRRPRAVEITRQTAAKFGYDLVPHGTPNLSTADIERAVERGIDRGMARALTPVAPERVTAAMVAGVTEVMKADYNAPHAIQSLVESTVRRELRRR